MLGGLAGEPLEIRADDVAERPGGLRRVWSHSTLTHSQTAAGPPPASTRSSAATVNERPADPRDPERREERLVGHEPHLGVVLDRLRGDELGHPVVDAVEQPGRARRAGRQVREPEELVAGLVEHPDRLDVVDVPARLMSR